MTKISDVTDFLESIAPLGLQEDYDNSGLLIGNASGEVTGVLCCLDCTEAVVEEAVTLNTNLIVAHHPIIFKGLKKITGANYVERVVRAAIKSDISIYAVHTNLDNVLESGVNQKIAARLGLQNIEILSPTSREGGESARGIDGISGSGIIGQLPERTTAVNFLALLKERLNAKCIRYTDPGDTAIQRVAVCGGSGNFLLETAIFKGADAFVSADFTYHRFFDAEGKVMIADVGHYESEQFTVNLLCDLISEKFSTFAARCTSVNTNPVRYKV